MPTNPKNDEKNPENQKLYDLPRKNLRTIRTHTDYSSKIKVSKIFLP
jgi:hypothetical protein